FSWEISTTPVDAGEELKPTATLTIDSTKVSKARLTALEEALYGTVGTDPRLPLPTEVFEMLAGDDVNEVVPTRPTQVGNSVMISTTTGVVYRINGVEVTGVVEIEEDTLVTATPAAGYKFPTVTDADWLFEYDPEA